MGLEVFGYKIADSHSAVVNDLRPRCCCLPEHASVERLRPQVAAVTAQRPDVVFASQGELVLGLRLDADDHNHKVYDSGGGDDTNETRQRDPLL